MVNKEYEEKTAVLFATGPSLTKDQIELVRPYHEAGKVVTFGCNDTYRVIDFLDVFYACDGTWWDYHIEKMNFFETCNAKEMWTQEKRIAEKYADKVKYIRGTHENGFNEVGEKIHYGSNSGYQQLNLAYLMGLSKFLLVGYNMGTGGKTHFFGEHPQGLNRPSPYARFIQAYGTIQQHINKKIINCTEPSGLTQFKKQTLKEALEEL